MNSIDINKLTPEEQELEKDLINTAPHFKTCSPAGLDKRIFEALNREHNKQQIGQPGQHWLKLLAAALLLFGLGLAYHFNATHLNSLLSERENTTSIFTILDKARDTINQMDTSEARVRTYGEIFLANQADAFMSDLAILTIDPTLEFMNQQRKLKDVLERR